MNKIEITKAVVNNMTGLSCGAVAMNLIKANRNHSDNTAIELLMSTSAFVTGYVVGKMMHDTVRKQSDQMIDDYAEWWKTNITDQIK